jgi:hypothetical protein
MMKNFIMSRAFPRGRNPEGDPGGRSVAPITGEAEVMTIIG